MNEKNVGQLRSGEIVINRYNSHLHDEEGEILKFLSEALSKISAQGRQFITEEIDFGRIIGETICVGTGSGDEIIYAQRPKRFGLTRFVKNREPEPCSSLVVILKKAEENNIYVLITAFVGKSPQPEPWDKNLKTREEKMVSKEYWSSHALIWEREPIIPGTEINKCPWSKEG